MADPYQNNITTLAKRLKPFLMGWVGTYITNIINGDIEGSALVNKIYRFDFGTTTVDVYDGDDAGLTAALSASSDGDIVWVLAHEIAGEHTVPAGVEIVGLGQENTILTGTLNLGAGSTMTNLSVIVVVESSDGIAAVEGPSSGEARIHECHIKGYNSGDGGGYGINRRGGEIYMEGGWLEGSTAPFTYVPNESEDWRDGYTFNILVGDGVVGEYAVELSNEYHYPPDTGSWTVRVEVVPKPGYPQILGTADYYATVWGRTYGTASVIGDGAYIEVWLGTAYGYITQQEDLDDLGGRSFDVEATTSGTLYFEDTPQSIEGQVVTGTVAHGSENHRIITATISLYSDAELALLTEVHDIKTFGVRMDPVVGEQVLGERSAYDMDNYAERHASDIEKGIFLYHLPTGAAVDDVPVWDGEEWIPGAGGGGSVIWYDEGVLGGTANIVNVTGDGGTVSVSGGTATLNITGGTGGGGSVTWYDEGNLAGTASIVNITGAAGTISISGGTATLNVTIPDHDHSGDVGDGGTFDAANLTSGTAIDGYVLTADGAGGAAWEVATGAGGGSVTIYDEGVIAGTVDKFNFTGDTLSATVSGGTAVIDVSGTVLAEVAVYDEGVVAGTVSIFNYTGSGVSASVSGGTAVVNIAGGDGGATDILQVQVFS